MDPPPPLAPPSVVEISVFFCFAAAVFLCGELAVDCLNGKVALQCGHIRVGEPTTPLHSRHSFRPLPSGVPGLCGANVGG